MTDATDRNSGGERRASLAALVGRLWRGALANKGLVAAMIGAALAETLFTRLPFLLVKPLFDLIEPTGEPAGQPASEPVGDGFAASLFGTRFSEAFVVWFRDFAIGLRDLLGIEFETASEQKTIILASAVVAAVCGVLGGLAIYYATVLSRYFATKIIVDLRNEVAEQILRLPLRFFGRRRMGELISRLTNDTTVLARSFQLVADHALVDPMMIALYALYVAVFAPVLLIFYLPAIPLMALPMIRLGKKVHRRSRSSLAAMGDSTESMNQMLSGIKTVKAYRLEDVRLAEFADSNRDYLAKTKRMIQAKGRSQGIVFVGYQVAFGAMITVLGMALLAGDVKLGDIAVVLIPISMTYQHVKRICRAYNTMMESVGAMDGIQSILDERGDVGGNDRSRRTLDVEGRVEIRDVSFAYGDEPVLREVDLAVEPGTTVALVGPSGAGKSTLIDLLMRFHDPDSGAVLIDGVDLREISLDAYRRRTAVVTQEPFLFNTTIEQNIRYGRPEATDDQIVAAAGAAQIHDFVATLPDGYQTVVGERGSNLSGGQKQRITIARAVLRDPAILFLDEATSALDSEKESAVQDALDNLMTGRTSFVIAHRLSTIRNADLILVLAEGRVVERGRHDDLVASGGVYHRLIELQDMRG